jgi:nucleoside-diphosphate-sugar epimerase
MRVLLTGADGYIGAVLAPLLVERGHDVTGLDTGFYKDGCLGSPGSQPIACTRQDTRRVTSEDLRGFDAVVHLADLSNDPLGLHSPAVTYAINHGATVRLASACKEVGIPRFVYSSSCSIYGAAEDGYRTEQSETKPLTPYAECKVLVERDLAAMADDRFSPTFLRNATAFGVSPRMRFDLVLNNLAGLAWTTGRIALVSDGTPWRPLVHVRDIARAFACALEAPRDAVHNQAFNVGQNGANYQVRDIAEIIAEVFPGCELSVGARNGDDRSYRVSFDKIHEQLPGFSCERDAKDGATELLEIFRRLNVGPETFNFRAFTRLRQLQHLLATRQIDDNFFWN